MLYKLKPLKWEYDAQTNVHTLHSPTHTYAIYWDKTEQSHCVHYHNLHTGDSDATYVSDIEEAKDWVESTHIPAKLLNFFEMVESNEAT